MDDWVWEVSLVGILRRAVVWGTDMFCLTTGRPNLSEGKISATNEVMGLFTCSPTSEYRSGASRQVRPTPLGSAVRHGSSLTKVTLTRCGLCTPGNQIRFSYVGVSKRAGSCVIQKRIGTWSAGCILFTSHLETEQCTSDSGSWPMFLIIGTWRVSSIRGCSTWRRRGIIAEHTARSAQIRRACWYPFVPGSGED
jgi:hypothetical protein